MNNSPSFDRLFVPDNKILYIISNLKIIKTICEILEKVYTVLLISKILFLTTMDVFKKKYLIIYNQEQSIYSIATIIRSESKTIIKFSKYLQKFNKGIFWFKNIKYK